MIQVIDKDLAEVLNDEMYKYSPASEHHYAGDFAEDGSIYTYNTCDKFLGIEELIRHRAEPYDWTIVRPYEMWFGSTPTTAGVWMTDKAFKTEAIKAGVYKVMHKSTKKTRYDLIVALNRAIEKAYRVMIDGTYIMQAGVHAFGNKKGECWDSEKRAVRKCINARTTYILSKTRYELLTTDERDVLHYQKTGHKAEWMDERVPYIDFFDFVKSDKGLRILTRGIANNNKRFISYVEHLDKMSYDALINDLNVDIDQNDYFKPALMILGESEHGRKFDFKTIY